MKKLLILLIILLVNLVVNAQTYYIDADLDGFGRPSPTFATPFFGSVTNGNDTDDNNPCVPNSSGCGQYHPDNDGDNFGASWTILLASTTANIQMNGLDCNDNDASINPNTKWYKDADADGFGNNAIYITQCTQPPPVGETTYIRNNTDCNDSNASINPNTKWYQDADADGFGNNAIYITQCTQPIGFVENNQDLCPTISGQYSGCIVPTPDGYGNAGFADNMNYIITSSPKIAVNSMQQLVNSNDVNIDITYFDGLGRPIQQVNNQQSNSGKNIITPILYDSFGRQDKEYLPFANSATSLNYVLNSTTLASQATYYNTASASFDATTYPYSQKQFETSPLNRILKLAAPGNDWFLGSGKEIKSEYQTNTTGDAVKQFSVTTTWNSSTNVFDIALVGSTNYSANLLYKDIIKNENWTSGLNNTTEEFKDIEGHVILKRTYSDYIELSQTQVIHDTYYVYDLYGNLTYVIPPLVNTGSTISVAILDGLCYQYKYDNRNRLVEKKLPGKQWEFIVYDKLDRPAATGPVFSPFSNTTGVGWMITKYDVFNRPILSAWQPVSGVTSSVRNSLQVSYNLPATIVNETKNTTSTDSGAINGISCRYSNVALPTSGYHILIVNYYDDYNFSFSPVIPTTIEGQNVFYNASVKPKGMPTGTYVRVPETITNYNCEKNTIFYDNKSRAIRSYKTNHLGGFTQIDSNFQPITGRLNYTVKTHSRASLNTNIINIKDEFTYSNQDRLLIQTQQINGSLQKQLIVSNTYDELGNLLAKKVGGISTAATSLQKVDFSYNIRGWLIGINDVNNLTVGSDPQDLFAFKINYNNVQNQGTYIGQPLFNGNISETYWKSSTDPNVTRKYGYCIVLK